jgi:hypothetical protein
MTETSLLSDEQPIDWREFLTDRPPGARARIDRAAFKTRTSSTA